MTWEYRVLTSTDSRWKGEIDAAAMQDELNRHAQDGWRLITSFAYYAAVKTNRAEVGLVLERSQSEAVQG
jgi:hypothetical protein